MGCMMVKYAGDLHHNHFWGPDNLTVKLCFQLNNLKKGQAPSRNVLNYYSIIDRMF